jgi:hypothetical protein
MSRTERNLTALSIALALTLSGCGQTYDQSAGEDAVAAAAETVKDTVDRAVAVARDLESEGNSAEQVLAEHGITLEKFEELLYEISSDSELAKKFSEALGL